MHTGRTVVRACVVNVSSTLMEQRYPRQRLEFYLKRWSKNRHGVHTRTVVESFPGWPGAAVAANTAMCSRTRVCTQSVMHCIVRQRTTANTARPREHQTQTNHTNTIRTPATPSLSGKKAGASALQCSRVVSNAAVCTLTNLASRHRCQHVCILALPRM